MSDESNEIRRLVAESEGLPNGPVKVELLTEAARIADVQNDPALGFAVRKILMNAALMAGVPDTMLVAFSWCAAQSDRDPASFPPNQILWEYRWVISELPHFPQVPREQIENTIREMATRYRAAGSTLRAVHLMRIFTYTKMCDVAAAEAAYADWRAVERDWLSDSPRQELNLLVNFYAFAGWYEKAINESPNVMTGRVDDAGLFAQDSAELLVPFLTLGRVTDAARIQRSAYRYLARKPGYIDHMAFHVEFLARTDNFPGATRVVDDHMALAVPTKQYVSRTHFLRSVLLLVERLRRAGHDRHAFKLPPDVPVSSDAGGCDLSALSEWLTAEVRDYSARFDARNGNTAFTDKLNAVPDLAARPAPAK
ncbi:hypothetical protein [Fimbriiglobus ruber]|uniref:Uncharacterized protein n=1 Tax=Fimbriiglobus ruber TaxID=1908690 RepID=A0A225DYR3_9BACT|nr:hypothetical protein [Fimbriiglobus ruber]OWK46670.1 hypothetical protein FRUB_00369 [Fimbriiglobus ruber]